MEKSGKFPMWNPWGVGVINYEPKGWDVSPVFVYFVQKERSVIRKRPKAAENHMEGIQE